MAKPEHYKYYLSIRLKEYNYTGPGVYFITICTKDRNDHFGTKMEGTVELNKNGLTARDCLLEIPFHFSNSRIIEYIIMPDHIHILISIAESSADFEEESINILGRDKTGSINGTIYRTSTENTFERFGKPSKGSIPTIIRTYKAAVTRMINRNSLLNGAKIWQPGYYEHVIRDDEELKYTKDYIKANPEA